MARRRGLKFAWIVTDERRRRPSDRELWKRCKGEVNQRRPDDRLAQRIARTITLYEQRGGTWEDDDDGVSATPADEHGQSHQR